MSTKAAAFIAVAIAALVLCSCGCASDYHPIPDGTYSYGEERVVVEGERMRFHILDEKEGPSSDKEYYFTVLPDGRIQPYPLASAEAALGIGKYDWFWNGDRIVRTIPHSGQSVDFARDH